jgi:hypothetical protein
MAGGWYCITETCSSRSHEGVPALLSRINAHPDMTLCINCDCASGGLNDTCSISRISSRVFCEKEDR